MRGNLIMVFGLFFLGTFIFFRNLYFINKYNNLQKSEIEESSERSEGVPVRFNTEYEGSGLFINSKTNKCYEVIYQPSLKYFTQGKEVSKEDFEKFVKNFNMLSE